MSETEVCPKKSVVVLNNLDLAPTPTSTKFTSREKRLTVTVIFLSILAFGLVAFIIVSGPLSSLLIPLSWNQDLEFFGVCDTRECVKISHRAIESADFEADPCQNFYHFACSKWQAKNPITTEQLYLAANINHIRDQVDTQIKTLLEGPSSNINSSSSENGNANNSNAAKAFYESCLNFSTPDESALVSELVASLGGYKTSDTWAESQFDLTTVTMEFMKVNAAPLFDLTLDIDARNRSKYALIVELPRPTSLVPNLVSRSKRGDNDFLLMEATLHNYNENSDGLSVNINKATSSSSSGPETINRQILYKMITDNVQTKKMDQLKVLAEKVGRMANLSEEELNADMMDIGLIASSIEKLKPSQRSRKFWKQQNKVYNSYTIDALQDNFDSINWKVLLTSLMGNKSAAFPAPTKSSSNRNSGVNPDTDELDWSEATIYVPYPDYLRRLFQAIQFTNKRLLHNTMLLIYVRDMLSDLIQTKKDEPRWKFCVQSTKSVFAMELSSLYLRSFESTYLHQVRSEVEEIFINVKDSLMSFLNRSTWLEVRSKGEAMRKIQTLKGNFLAPSFYQRADYLDEALKNIRIDSSDFYSNVRLVYQTFREQLYRLYWTQVDEDRATWAFVTFPTTVNAFYIQQFNSIVVPLAFLNPPHYTQAAPKYINYATIALTIAHEALHALDSSGSDFDADGKLQDWWQDDSRGFLREKSSCVAKQYTDSFRKNIPFYKTHVHIQVDGNLTQNENLADIAGLQVAFDAYASYRKITSREGLKSELKIPGLKYSLEQIYFLTVAQAYCANVSPMGYVFLLEMDEHTPHPERINGMLMNIPEFSKAYNCPVGSRMNPEQKCFLW